MKNYDLKFRKSFVALKLIFGGNEQALILVDLLETYAYRSSEEYVNSHGDVGITEDSFFAKSRALITEDTGVLTASVKTAVDALVGQGFIIATSDRYLQKYKKSVIHYQLRLDTDIYLQKANEYLSKSHRPDDKEAVKNILVPFMNKLTFYDNIIEALGLGTESQRKFREEKKSC